MQIYFWHWWLPKANQTIGVNLRHTNRTRNGDIKYFEIHIHNTATVRNKECEASGQCGWDVIKHNVLWPFHPGACLWFIQVTNLLMKKSSTLNQTSTPYIETNSTPPFFLTTKVPLTHANGGSGHHCFDTRRKSWDVLEGLYSMNWVVCMP